VADSYLIDANVFVQAKNLHYRFEFCGGFWHWLESAHAAGLVFSADKVRSELVAGRKGDPAMTWAEQQPAGFFLPDAADAVVMRHYGTLMQWASTGGHYTPAAISEFAASKNADPFIVAVAKVHKCTVVTQERTDANAKRRVPLPNAAAVLGVKTLSIFDLLSKHAASTFQFKP